ncbi:Methyltransf_25 domain-containing protein [Gammaproteobacteria bacterium]
MVNPGKTKVFYDSKANQKSKLLDDKICGSDSIPLYLRTPYLLAENYLQLKIKQAGVKLKLLDLCCGTGVYAVKFAKLDYIVSGVDISSVSIDEAINLAKEFNVAEQLDFVVQEVAQQLDFSDESFDVVFISGSLYYLDFEKIVPEILRVLKKGGVFVCIETNGDDFIMNFIRKIKNIFLRHRDNHTINNLLRYEDIKKILQFLPSASIKYFDFFTLAGCLFAWNGWLLENWLKLAVPLDDFFLNKLRLRVFGFKFVIIGEK